MASGRQPISILNYDPARTIPLEVAHHNEQEFVVEAMNGHRGDRHKRSTMEFRVRWAGFGETCDSWEHYRALLHVDKLYNQLPQGQCNEVPHTEQTQVASAENRFQDFPRNLFTRIATATDLFPDDFSG
jgi:hypothetical protein